MFSLFGKVYIVITPQTASQESSSCGVLLEVEQQENMLRRLDICEMGVKWRKSSPNAE